MKYLTASKKLFLTVLVFSVVILNVSVAFAQSPSQDVGSLISSLFLNTSSLIVFTIEFALGVGLGYFSVKVIKYILAIIIIFVIGVVLSVWTVPNIGVNIQQQLGSLGVEWPKIYPVVISIIYMLGLITILPITLGFIIGALVAIFK